MNLCVTSIPLSNICKGCLSVGRKLTLLIDGECRKYFIEMLHDLEDVNHAVLLCWECAAIIKKSVSFRRQVKRAHDILIKHMLHQIQLSTLSNLSVSITQHTTNNVACEKTPKLEISHLSESASRIQTCNTENDTQKYETSLNDRTANTESPNNPSSEAVNGAETPNRSLTQPLTFIKIEDQDMDFGDDVEGFYIDENLDDKTLKTVLKSDPFQYEVLGTKKKKAKRKKTRKKAEVEEFNESDDEPLTVKKKRTEDKKHKRSSKKRTDGGLTKEKRPGTRREKPAGVVINPRVEKKLKQLNVDSGQLEMVVLSWEEVEAERQRALSSATFTRHQYRCYQCVVGFNHRSKLDEHMRKHDPTSGASPCCVCGVRCRDAHALAAHRRRHRLRWRCARCGSLWSRAAVAADHATRAHGAPPPTHTCSTCGHCADTLGKLRNHIKNHAERQKCELCGKTFRDRTSLRTHLFIHKGEKEYGCPQCDKRFLFKKAMEVHLVTHDAPAQLYCYQCDMNFKNRMSYYQHMKYNLKHIDPAKLKYACQLCDKKFVKATRLEEHHVAVHLKATPIQCTVAGCNFACSSRPVLRTHTRLVHRNCRAARNHVCHACGKAYTTKKTLEGHMRTHTGERPFRCALCPSAFGYEAALYNHNKLVHLKDKSGRGRGRSAAPPVRPTPSLSPPQPQRPGPSWGLPLAAPLLPPHATAELT